MTSELTYYDCEGKCPIFYVVVCLVWMQIVVTNVCSSVTQQDLLHVVCVVLFLVVWWIAPQDKHSSTYHMY